MYHHIRNYQNLTSKAAQDISVSPQEFDAQLNYLHASGYNTITSQDIVDNTVPCKSVMITFDDGYFDVYQNAFPIMRKYNYVWIIGLIVAKMDESDYLFWRDIYALQSAWWEIASHTWNHAILTRIKNFKLIQEVKNSKKSLEKWFHTPIHIFVYPGWYYDIESLKSVQESSYRYALTTRFWEADLHERKFELRRINIIPGISPEKLADLLEMATLLQ